MKKIYISIPISGHNYIDQRNLAKKIANELKATGKYSNVVTPFDKVTDASTSYNVAMGMCIEELLTCQAIYLCSGYECSKGCLAEEAVAKIYGIEIIKQNDFE